MNDAKLLCCGRCRGVWFCNRECQDVARKELGHRGANCRPADGAQRPASLANARSPFAAPSRPKATDVAILCQRFSDLLTEGRHAFVANTRIGYLAAAENIKKAASLADFIGGVEGAGRRARADQLLVSCLLSLGNTAAAARAACSSLWAARAAGSRMLLVQSLVACGNLASQAPDEMVKAERVSREQERLGGAPSYWGLDLSQERWVSLPTTPATLSRLGVAYHDSAVAICDTALTAASSRDSPAADDERRVPLRVEAEARGCLGICLHDLGERQRGVELLRQAVALLRLAVRKAAPGFDLLVAKQALASVLCYLADMRNAGSDGTAETEACLREALALCEDTDDVALNQRVLSQLANMSGLPDDPVKPAEAAALRSRLNALYAQAGRNHGTSCTICLETLEQSDGGAENDAADRGADDYTNSSVRVLEYGHQFHLGCLSTWWRTAASQACPLCKK